MHVRDSGRVQARDCGARARPSDFAAGLICLSLPRKTRMNRFSYRSYETTLAEGVRFERRLFHATFALEDQK